MDHFAFDEVSVAPEPSRRELTPGDVAASIARHWVGALVILVLSFSVGAVAYRLTKPVYRSTTQILVEGKTASSSADDPISEVSMPNSDLDLGTQIAVIQSSRMINDALEKAGLGQAEVQKGSIPTIKVEQVPETNVLNLSVEGTDPTIVHLVSDITPQVYMQYVRDTRQAELSNALNFLTTSLTTQQAQLKSAVAALETFKGKRRLLPLQDEAGTRTGQVSNSQQQLASAEAQVAAAQQRLSTLKAERDSLPKMRKTPNTESNSLEIEAEKSKIADLETQRKVLLEHWLPTSEKVTDIDAQIKSEQLHLDELPKTHDLSSESLNPERVQLDSNIDEAEAAVKSAEAERDHIAASHVTDVSQLKQFNNLQPEQNALEQAVSDQHVAVNNLQRSIDELKLRMNAVRDPVQVLAAATSSTKVRPVSMLYVGAAGLVGVFLAFGFCLVRGSMDDRLDSDQQVSEVAGAPLLGYLPSLPRRSAGLVRADEPSAMMENLRLICFKLMCAAIDHALTSVVITSSSSGEGKTDLAWRLGYAMARDNRRVIIVDANLRNPELHELANVGIRPGLTDVLLGENTLDEVLHETGAPGLRILTAGSEIANPGDLLLSNNMRVLHEELKLRADLVIFDSPPCLDTADANVLAHLADSVLYITSKGSSRTALRSGIKMLRQAQGKLLGVITRDPHVTSKALARKGR